MAWRVCQYLSAFKSEKTVSTQAVMDEELDVLTNFRLEDCEIRGGGRLRQALHG